MRHSAVVTAATDSEADDEIDAEEAAAMRVKNREALQSASTSLAIRGLPYMTSANMSDLFTPSPNLVSCTKQLILFICLLFGDPPPRVRTSYIWKPPI